MGEHWYVNSEASGSSPVPLKVFFASLEIVMILSIMTIYLVVNVGAQGGSSTGVVQCRQAKER